MQLCTSANLEEEVFRKLSKLEANEEIVANVNLLIELHGGKIWAESQGKDKGAKFSFTLKAVGNNSAMLDK